MNAAKESAPATVSPTTCNEKREKDVKKEVEVAASRSDETVTEREDARSTEYPANEDQASSISSSSKAKYPKVIPDESVLAV